jgi:BirA family biotin operon repressor/biotin-[acetyl-CoA-carboxylase] ligase
VISQSAPLERRVFNVLCDGKACSGQVLATQLGVTRSAVWKAIEKLRALGLAIQAQRSAGYALPQAVTPLAAPLIAAQLSASERKRLRQLQVAWSLGSTNDELLGRTGLRPGQYDVLLAEYQQAGRGRRARQWLGAPGASLCLSIGWQYAALPADSGALSLAVGVAVLHALRKLHDAPLQLKWPNDLLLNQHKLGGILRSCRACLCRGWHWHQRRHSGSVAQPAVRQRHAASRFMRRRFWSRGPQPACGTAHRRGHRLPADLCR